MGFEPRPDPTRKQVFYALDQVGRVVGTFVTNPVFFYGILFKTYGDRVTYEQVP